MLEEFVRTVAESFPADDMDGNPEAANLLLNDYASSDWLLKHDEAIRKEAREQALEEVANKPCKTCESLARAVMLDQTGAA